MRTSKFSQQLIGEMSERYRVEAHAYALMVASYECDDAARLTTRTLANGVVTTYTFYAVDNVTSITMPKAGATIW